MSVHSARTRHRKERLSMPAVVCARCRAEFKIKPSAVVGARYCSWACRYPADASVFWGLVDRESGHRVSYVVGECWLWKGNRGVRGYGRFSRRHRNYLAHRIAWELIHGPVPVGLLVCHHCDVPHCVRPTHLFLGTGKDNQQDAARKGRMRGERHSRAQLTNGQVEALRLAWAQGRNTVQLAKQFSISPQNAYAIVHRKSWRHLP
jgi:hypothetical protein